MNPKVSIIIPNYNHELFLKQRLDSVFNQTFQDFEVILLDDCSTDHSRALLSKYSNHPKVSHCVFNTVNSGNTFIQWNKGIALAKGEFIWIAESDDYCATNFLEEVIKPLINDSEVVLAYCQSNKVNEKEKVTGNWKHQTNWLSHDKFNTNFTLEGNLFIEKYLIFINVIPNASGVLMRKDKLLKIGTIAFENDLKYSGDWLLYIKLITNSKIAFVAENLNNFRYHSSSVIATMVKNKRKINIINANLFFRTKALKFLKEQQLLNFNSISKNNKKVIKELKYEKAGLLLNENKKIQGFFVMLSTFPFFLKRYKFIKNTLKVLENVFSKIHKPKSNV